MGLLDDWLKPIGGAGIGFLAGGPVGAIIGGVGGFAQQQQQDAMDRAQRQAEAYTREHEIRQANARHAQQQAEAEALGHMFHTQQQGQQAMLDAQNESFNLLRQADDEEKEAMAQFREGIEGLRKTKKQVALEQEKSKRRKAVGKAIKGEKISGTTEGSAAGGSETYKAAEAQAVAEGIKKGLQTGAMEATLSAYGPDQMRESGIYTDLSAEGRRLGDNAQRTAQLAPAALGVGRAAQGLYDDMARQQYQAGMANAAQLGYVPPLQSRDFEADAGLWDTLGPLSSLALTAYGAGYGGPGQGWSWENIWPKTPPTHSSVGPYRTGYQWPQV